MRVNLGQAFVIKYEVFIQQRNAQDTVTEVMSAHGRALGGAVTWMLCPRSISQNCCYSSQGTVTCGSLCDEAENRINSCAECVNGG